MNNSKHQSTFAWIAACFLVATMSAGCIDDSTPPPGNSSNNDPTGYPNGNAGSSGDVETPVVNQTRSLVGSRTLNVTLTETPSHSISGNPSGDDPGYNCLELDVAEVYYVNSGTLTVSWDEPDDVREIQSLIFFWDFFGAESDNYREVEGASPLELEIGPAENVDDVFIGVRETHEYAAIQNLSVEFTWDLDYEGIEDAAVHNAWC